MEQGSGVIVFRCIFIRYLCLTENMIHDRVSVTIEETTGGRASGRDLESLTRSTLKTPYAVLCRKSSQFSMRVQRKAREFATPNKNLPQLQADTFNKGFTYREEP